MEESDGRRRCGRILILKGRYGLRWEQLIVEVGMANFSLREANKGKKDKEGKGMRSYIEVLALKEPYVRTNKAQEDVSPAMAPMNQILARILHVYPKLEENMGKVPTVPASHFSERLSAMNSYPE